MMHDKTIQQDLAFDVREVIERAKQPDCADRAMVVQLGMEDSTDFPCTMFAEGVTIPLMKLNVVMAMPDKNIVFAEFDQDGWYKWRTSEGFQIKKLCFDLENNRAYAVYPRDKKIFFITEILLRAQAENVYFLARYHGKTKHPLHFAYTNNPELQILLDDLVEEKQREMLQKGEIDNA